MYLQEVVRQSPPTTSRQTRLKVNITLFLINYRSIKQTSHHQHICLQLQPPAYFKINHVMNHSSDDDVRLHDGGGAPDVEQQEKQHDQPDVLQHHVYALVFAAISVELAQVYHCQHDQDEEVEHEGEGLGSTGQDVQGSDDQEREEGQLEFVDLLYCLLDGRIFLLDPGGLDGSMVKGLRTLLSIHLRLLLTLLILALPFTFPTPIDQFFDDADNHDDEVNQHEEEGDEDDASLTILNLSVRHFNSNQKYSLSNIIGYHIFIGRDGGLWICVGGRSLLFFEVAQQLTMQNSKSANKKITISQDNLSKTMKLDESTKSPKKQGKDVSSPKNASEKKRYMQSGNIKGDDFTKQMENKENQLGFKKQKLCACINLFNLMQSSSNQLRCVQHNNVLTLYCLTQRKVLCVNCTYSDFRHKIHKILPLKDSTKYINEDNLLLKEILSKDLKCIEDSVRNCQENSLILQRELKVSLDKLQKDFSEKMEALKNSYEQDTQRVTKLYKNLINKSQVLQKEIQEFKFKIWETVSKIGIGKKGSNQTQEIQIIHQVLCSSLSELTRFQMRRITKKELQRITHKSKFS